MEFLNTDSSSSPPPFLCSSFQGGLRLSCALSILVQPEAVAGLLHLHSLGILHRDLRAANLLLDSLRLDHLHARVADFGVSHPLTALATGLQAADLTAGKVPTAVLRGSGALGPMQVCGC